MNAHGPARDTGEDTGDPREKAAEETEETEKSEETEAGAEVEGTAGEVEGTAGEEARDRLRRRAAFLRELAEARELRRRVAPRRSRRAEIHAALRKSTFRPR